MHRGGCAMGVNRRSTSENAPRKSQSPPGRARATIDSYAQIGSKVCAIIGEGALARAVAGERVWAVAEGSELDAGWRAGVISAPGPSVSTPHPALVPLSARKKKARLFWSLQNDRPL